MDDKLSSIVTLSLMALSLGEFSQCPTLRLCASTARTTRLILRHLSISFSISVSFGRDPSPTFNPCFFPFLPTSSSSSSSSPSPYSSFLFTHFSATPSLLSSPLFLLLLPLALVVMAMHPATNRYHNSASWQLPLCFYLLFFPKSIQHHCIRIFYSFVLSFLLFLVLRKKALFKTNYFCQWFDMLHIDRQLS